MKNAIKVASKIGYDMYFVPEKERIVFMKWEFKIPIEHNGKIYSIPVRKLNKTMQAYALKKYNDSQKS